MQFFQLANEDFLYKMLCPSKRLKQNSIWRLCELKDAGAKYIPKPVLVVQTVCTCTECSIANTYNIGWQVETFLIEFSSSKYNKQVMRVWTHQGIRVTMSLYLRRLTSKTKKLVFFKHKDLIHFFSFIANTTVLGLYVPYKKTNEI